MTIEERKELLAKSSWTYKDVMLYTNTKKSKAFQIIKICKEQLNGKILFNDHCVRRDSVLAYCGTSIERERYVIKQLEEQEDKPMPVRN